MTVTCSICGHRFTQRGEALARAYTNHMNRNHKEVG